MERSLGKGFCMQLAQALLKLLALLGMVAQIFDPSTSKTSGSLKFKSSLVYIVSPRSTRIT